MADIIYNKNDVMKIIGRHSACPFIGPGKIANDDFMKVVEAHRTAAPRNNSIFFIGIDFFMLGMIYGRKAERAKRNHKPITPLKRKRRY